MKTTSVGWTTLYLAYLNMPFQNSQNTNSFFLNVKPKLHSPLASPYRFLSLFRTQLFCLSVFGSLELLKWLIVSYTLTTAMNLCRIKHLIVTLAIQIEILLSLKWQNTWFALVKIGKYIKNLSHVWYITLCFP